MLPSDGAGERLAREDVRARVAEAVLRWEGEGFRTARLEALLEEDAPGAVDEAINGFARDVERLQTLAAEVAELDPQAAGDAVFRDPERLDEAEKVAEKVLRGSAPPPAPSCTSTSCPSSRSACTIAGTAPTRFSCSLISLGMPMIMV